jgi:hypothetical protein
MPKLPQEVQLPLALYPPTSELVQNRGIINADLTDLPIDPDQRITYQRLAGLYGKLLGPLDGLQRDEDIILEVTSPDFAQASPSNLKNGLYIESSDPRYYRSTTEQLVRSRPKGARPPYTGVVFPAREYAVIAGNPKALAQHAMSKTRKANLDNDDPVVVEGRVGRAGAHILSQKIQGLNSLDNDLIDYRDRLLVPLYRATRSTWRASFKAYNLDRLRREFDEMLHDTVDTAVLNMDIDLSGVRAIHRAITSNMTRRGNAAERTQRINGYVEFIGKYITARRKRVHLSRAESEDTLVNFEPFTNLKTLNKN